MNDNKERSKLAEKVKGFLLERAQNAEKTGRFHLAARYYGQLKASKKEEQK